MNQQQPSTEADALQALAKLGTSRDWQRIPGVGAGNHQVYVRVWGEGSTDMLVVRSETDSEAQRLNSYGQLVYRETGTVVATVGAITGLAAPGTPRAPVQILRPPAPEPGDPIYEHVDLPGDNP